MKPELQNTTVPGTAPVHSLYGSHKEGSGGVTHQQGNIKPAGVHSTAPYKKPKRWKCDNPDSTAPLCAVDGCQGYASKKHVHFCTGHGRWMSDEEKKAVLNGDPRRPS